MDLNFCLTLLLYNSHNTYYANIQSRFVLTLLAEIVVVKDGQWRRELVVAVDVPLLMTARPVRTVTLVINRMNHPWGTTMMHRMRPQWTLHLDNALQLQLIVSEMPRSN